MKIYIAGKVTGLENYKKPFKEAENELRAEGNVCMNPADLGEGFPWEAYMPICYAMIDQCESIFMLKNWIDSKGAKLELKYAKDNGKIVIFQEDYNK